MTFAVSNMITAILYFLPSYSFNLLDSQSEGLMKYPQTECLSRFLRKKTTHRTFYDYLHEVSDI